MNCYKFPWTVMFWIVQNWVLAVFNWASLSWTVLEYFDRAFQNWLPWSVVNTLSAFLSCNFTAMILSVMNCLELNFKLSLIITEKNGEKNCRLRKSTVYRRTDRDTYRGAPLLNIRNKKDKTVIAFCYKKHKLIWYYK